MIEVSFPIGFRLAVLDAAARMVNAGILGVSSGPNGSRVHLPAGVEGAVLAQMNAMLAAFGSLVVQASALSIPADDVTSVSISLSTVDPDVLWMVLEDGVVLGSGIEAAVAGVVTLSFKTAAAGVYDIWLLRRRGDFATGFVRITVTEV